MGCGKTKKHTSLLIQLLPNSKWGLQSLQVAKPRGLSQIRGIGDLI